MNPLKNLAALLPPVWQQELKRRRYRRQILQDKFKTDEPEFLILDTLVAPGDWVIDVGANVGHYTKRFSDLVGPSGRVIAVEPVPATFALLAGNVALFKNQNVTLLNVAASDRTATVGISVPNFKSGLKNYYEAAITESEAGLQVMTLALNSLSLTHSVSVIKIDAEGHDPVVLEGLEQLLVRDHPVVIIETSSVSAAERLEEFGYVSEKLAGSPNVLFKFPLQSSTL